MKLRVALLLSLFLRYLFGDLISEDETAGLFHHPLLALTARELKLTKTRVQQQPSDLQAKALGDILIINCNRKTKPGWFWRAFQLVATSAVDTP